MRRTPESLRNRWSIIAQEEQVYLITHAQVMKYLTSGQTKEKLDKLTMDMCCSWNKRKDADGVERMALSLMYVGVANYLSRFPKFGGIDTAGKRRAEAKSAHLNEMLSLKKKAADVDRADARRKSMRHCMRRNDVSVMLNSWKR